jgi:flagellar biosynthetic protein FliO
MNSALALAQGTGGSGALPSNELPQIGTPGVGFGWVVVFLVALIAVALYLQRRLGIPFSRRGEAPLRMLSSLALGDRRAIVMVEAGKERLVVGVTSSSIRLICRLRAATEGAGDDALPDPGIDAEARERGSLFRLFFQRAVSRGERP